MEEKVEDELELSNDDDELDNLVVDYNFDGDYIPSSKDYSSDEEIICPIISFFF